MNDEYMGLYCLVELPTYNVEQMGGVLCEYDTYWWNTDKEAFESECLDSNMKYVVKYPSNNYEEVHKMKNAIDKIEDDIEEGRNEVLKDIDMDSFIGWLLVKDILGNADPCGSNIYYYILDGDKNVIYMGPGWDFDAIGGKVNSGLNYDYATYEKYMPVTYFSYLFANYEFHECYRARYKSLRHDLYTKTCDYLTKLSSDEDLKLSLRLESDALNKKIATADITADNMKKWLNQRLQVLDMRYKTTFDRNKSDDRFVIGADIDAFLKVGEYYELSPSIFALNTSNPTDINVAVIIDNHIYNCSFPAERPDVAMVFGDEYLMSGLYCMVKTEVIDNANLIEVIAYDSEGNSNTVVLKGE